MSFSEGYTGYELCVSSLPGYTGSRVHYKFNTGCLNRISIDAIWDLFVGLTGKGEGFRRD